MNFSELDIKINPQTRSFKFYDTEIEFVNYLPFSDKYVLLTNSINQANEDGVINPLVLDMCFHLNLFVSCVTNIDFNEEENSVELYDKISSNGLLNMFLKEFDEEEYNYLLETLEVMAADANKKNNSFEAVLTRIMELLPQSVEEAKKNLESLDPATVKKLGEKVKEIGIIK